MVLFLPRVSAFLQSQKVCPSVRPISLSLYRHCQQSSHCRPSFRLMSTFKYPETRREELVENLHGVDVPDPYRWLENPKSQETNAFVASQNTLFEDYISKFQHTDAYREILTKAHDYERYGAPRRCGNRWYYSYNEGLRSQSVWYAIDGEAIDSTDQGKVFFDPNTLSEDGTLSMNTHNWSKDGSHYAVALSQSGSDWCHVRIRNISTGHEYPERLQWLKFTSLDFTHDNKGLFYLRLPEPVETKDAGTETGKNGNARAYYHTLGTDQSEDTLIYFDPENPENLYYPYVTFDGEWLLMRIKKDTGPVNKLWVAKLKNGSLPSDGKLKWIKLKDDFDTGLEYVTNIGNMFYFESNHNAPKYKVVRYDLDRPEAGFVTVVPEQPHAVLEAAYFTNKNFLILKYSHNVQHKVFVVPLESVVQPLLEPSDITKSNGVVVNGSVHTNGVTKAPKMSSDDAFLSGTRWIGLRDAQELKLPVGCSIRNISCHDDEPRVFLHCSGYTLAGRIYKYTLNAISHANCNNHGSANGTAVCNSPKPFGFEPDRWAVEQVWVPNPNDGVKIPMYIIRDKSLVKTGDAFCQLSGYGGFGISVTPSFSTAIASMLTHTGGLYCSANIRGGGEFGEEWHKAAVREKRPVAFADFEECGRYLIREGWTRKEKLVCIGASNGGALVGAVMNRTGQEIFAAGIARVGVLDLLRYHRFTIGYAWKSDFGDPDVKEDFEFLYKWSPYHNVQDGKEHQYPAILCETSDHDDRVVPLHSFKFVAALQHAAGKTNRAPLFLRHHLKAGHGAGKPTKKIIEEETERFAFMMLATGTTFIPLRQRDSVCNGM